MNDSLWMTFDYRVDENGHPFTGPASSPKQEFYELRGYHLKTREQESRVDKYLQGAFLPALHRLGIAKVGVFKPVGNDTAAVRRIYVLLTFRSLEQFVGLFASLQKDAQYLVDGKDYLDAEYTNAPYERIEHILLQAFPDAPQLLSPGTLKAPLTERFYELRSYECPTEKYFANKIRMFNQGGEVALFKKHDCDAISAGMRPAIALSRQKDIGCGSGDVRVLLVSADRPAGS